MILMLMTMKKLKSLQAKLTMKKFLTSKTNLMKVKKSTKLVTLRLLTKMITMLVSTEAISLSKSQFLKKT